MNSKRLLWPFFQDVRATQQDLSDPHELVLLFYGDGKTVTPLCYCLQEEHAFFLILTREKAQMVPIKNISDNVNHIMVTRLREVYSVLGWLPEGYHDPEAAQRVVTKFSANVTIELWLSCNVFFQK